MSSRAVLAHLENILSIADLIAAEESSLLGNKRGIEHVEFYETYSASFFQIYRPTFLANRLIDKFELDKNSRKHLACFFMLSNDPESVKPLIETGEWDNLGYFIELLLEKSLMIRAANKELLDAIYKLIMFLIDHKVCISVGTNACFGLKANGGFGSARTLIPESVERLHQIS